MAWANLRRSSSGRQFAEAVSKFDATGIELETFRDPRIILIDPGQRGLRRRVFVKQGHRAIAEIWLDMFNQNLGKNIRPGVVFRDAHAANCSCRQALPVTLAALDGRKQVDAGTALERGRHGQHLRLGKDIDGAASKIEMA